MLWYKVAAEGIADRQLPLTVSDRLFPFSELAASPLLASHPGDDETARGASCETVSWVYLNSCACFNHGPFQMNWLHLYIFRNLFCLKWFNILKVLGGKSLCPLSTSAPDEVHTTPQCMLALLKPLVLHLLWASGLPLFLSHLAEGASSSVLPVCYQFVHIFFFCTCLQSLK